MPLFVRAGTVLPMGPVMQHTGEWPPEALQLHVFPGDGQSWLYEDDGHSLSYRDGEFRTTRFTCQIGRDGLVLRRNVEGPFHPGCDRFEITLYRAAAEQQQVLLDGQRVPAAFDAGQRTTQLTVGPWTELRVV
jgi:alpha-glucosidase